MYVMYVWDGEIQDPRDKKDRPPQSIGRIYGVMDGGKGLKVQGGARRRNGQQVLIMEHTKKSGVKVARR